MCHLFLNLTAEMALKSIDFGRSYIQKEVSSFIVAHSVVVILAKFLAWLMCICLFNSSVVYVSFFHV